MKDFNLETNKKISSGFTIPENYFDDFTEIVMQKIETKPNVISINKKPNKWYLSIAAIAVLSLSIHAINYFNQKNTEEIYQQDIENYLTQNAQLTTDDIANYIFENETTILEIENHIDQETIETELLENTNIEYLLN